MKYERLTILFMLLLVSTCLSVFPGHELHAAEPDRDISVDVDADPPVVPPEVRASIARAQKYLKTKQKEDGSFGGVAHTALSTLALMVDGSIPGYGPYGKEVARATRFLVSTARPSGLIARKKEDRGGAMYHHGLATLCLAEVWGMTGDREIRPVLKRAVDLIIRCQNKSGGWRYNPTPKKADLSVTVMQVVALRAAQNAGIAVSDETIEKAVKYVKSLQGPKSGGGFGYTGPGKPAPPRSAAGVISLQLCGEYKCKEVEKGLEYVWKQSKKDFRKLRGRSYYFHYYAMQAMYQSRDVKKWREWYPKACKWMMSKQGSRGHIGETYQTAMAVLAMGLPYRYLPIYQR